MIAVFRKEINHFFSSLIGYIAIIIFLLVIGLFLWVFPETSLFTYKLATLDSFFDMAPWIFLFLIPAICMRSFSEEYQRGTIEILSTKPLTDLQIILGKYLASLSVVLFALIPTLLYFVTIYQLSNPAGNMDTGATMGSYIGLFLIGACFTAIGIFSSSITNNQIVAFVIGVFLCFFFFQAFELLSKLSLFYSKIDHIIDQIGINAHYKSISRGVVDTRDLVYFLTLIAAFLALTRYVLNKKRG